MGTNNDHNTSFDAKTLVQLTEHSVKIQNLESIATDSNRKIDTLLEEIRNLRLSVSQNKCSNPALCNSLEPRLISVEKTVEELKPIVSDLKDSKNRIIGAVTLGSIFGTVLGVIGTWVVELLSRR